MSADNIVAAVVALAWLAVTVIFIRVGIDFRRIGREAEATADRQEARLAALNEEACSDAR